MFTVSVSVDAIIQFCQRHPIKSLSLFGSALRSDFNADSDVDLLVEFDADSTVDLFDMVQMEDELSRIVGRPVDLRTPAELSTYFRQQVLDSAVPLYER